MTEHETPPRPLVLTDEDIDALDRARYRLWCMDAYRDGYKEGLEAARRELEEEQEQDEERG